MHEHRDVLVRITPFEFLLEGGRDARCIKYFCHAVFWFYYRELSELPSDAELKKLPIHRYILKEQETNICARGCFVNHKNNVAKQNKSNRPIIHYSV